MERVRKTVFISPRLFWAVALVLLVSLSGCRAGGRGRTTTDWSLPSVSLPSAKKGDEIAKPADRADARSTAALAQDRAAGNNPTVAPSKDDPSLSPNAQEMAQLSRFDGEPLPSWAGQPELPPAPEPFATSAAQRVAQNVDNPPAFPELPQPPQGSPQMDDVAATAPAAGAFPGALPDGPIPIAPPPSASVPAPNPAPQPLAVGESMTEFPSNPPVQPAAFSAPAPFLPGNINPQYPSSPTPR